VRPLEIPGIRAEYVHEDGIPTGEALLTITRDGGEAARVVLSPEDAERLGDILVQIASARPRGSADNFPNDLGAGI
jgi:hypothetical protein